jgi:isochorismate synthase
MLEPTGETNIYVNLRCMEIGESSLTLFAGSGLLASSTCKEEWRETEQKLKTMASIIN